MIFRPAGPASVCAMRVVPCTAALKKAYSAPSSRVCRPLRLKFTVRFLARLAALLAHAAVDAGLVGRQPGSVFHRLVVVGSQSATACAA